METKLLDMKEDPTYTIPVLWGNQQYMYMYIEPFYWHCFAGILTMINVICL